MKSDLEVKGAIPSNLIEIKEYVTNVGRVHHFSNYYYDPDKLKMYRLKKTGLREIVRNNTYFILRNSEKKNSSVSWIKLDHYYLKNQPRTKWWN